MFEREIKFISDFTLNKIKKLGSLFTFEKLAELNIHPAILQYVSAELDYIIYEDRNKLLQNSVFDYSGLEILNYFNLIGKEIKKNKKIAFEDIKVLIIQAVSFNANYVARPNWSLSKLIFHENDMRSAQDLRLMLNYIYYYGYIKDIFSSYLSKRRITNLSVAEFELLLNKIDKEVLGKQESKMIDTSLSAIGDFFNEGGINKSKVSLNTVELFLKEKNLVDKLLNLKNVLPFDEKQKFELSEIRNIIVSNPIEADKNQETINFEENKEINDEIEEKNEFNFEAEEEEVAFNEYEETNSELGEISDEAEIINTEKINFDTEEIADEKSDDILDIEPPDEEGIVFEEKDPDKTVVIGNYEENENIEDILEEDKDQISEVNENEFEISDEQTSEFDNSIERGLDSEDSILDTKDYNNEPFDTDQIEKTVDQKTGDDEFEDLIIEEKNEKENYKDGYELVKNNFDLNDESEETEEDGLIIEDKIENDEIIEHQFENDIINIEEESLKQTEEINKIEKEIEKIERLNEKVDPLTKNKIETDIFRYLTQRDMERIISNIFNEDRDDFTNTMEKIAECSNYDEAIEILKGVFFTYRVSPYTRDAITLTNVVSFFFNQAS